MGVRTHRRRRPDRRGNDPDVPLLLEDPVTIVDRFRGFLSTQEG